MRAEGTASEFNPRIIGFLCNWCCYGGADLCGVSRFQYPPYLRVIRLMCSGRVDLGFVLRAFEKGADGVFIGGCHINDCHYNTEGNHDALVMTHLCRLLLAHAGVDPERLRIEWVSAGEGIRFAAIMNEFGSAVRRLGPLAAGEGGGRQQLAARLRETARLIPYIKLAKKDKLALHLADTAQYAGLFSREEVEALLREAPTYAIDPDRCRACMLCLKKCPVGAILGGKKTIHAIDPEKCIRCGSCLEACPPRFGAVRRTCGLPAAPPPEEARRTGRSATAP